MYFDGALIKEQGVKFAVAIVKSSVGMGTRYQKQEAVNYLHQVFGAVPIVLMWQDSHGVPSYWGRTDIVNFLCRLHPSQIPWQRFTLAA